jgi:hypothetical protein
MCGGSGSNKIIDVMCANIPTTVKEHTGGDWTNHDCGSGMYLLGGGCKANGPHIWEANRPQCDNNGCKWQCGGHGGSKTVRIVCSATHRMDVTHPAAGKDWQQSPHCDGNTYLIGGGCRAYNSPHRMEKHGKESDTSWMCGGSGAKKQAYAICLAKNAGNHYSESDKQYHTRRLGEFQDTKFTWWM